MKLGSLSTKERLQLLRFVCSSIWADLRVRRLEKTFLFGLVQRMNLGDSDVEQVKGWLEAPAPPEEVDPTSIPPEHRRLFLEAVERALVSDGQVNPEEAAFLDLFRELIR